MAGGPSQLELFDFKPQLQKYSGQPIPDSFIQGRRFAFMDIFTKEHPKLLGTVRKFAQYGQSGAWVSALLPRHGRGGRRPDVRQIGGDRRLQPRSGQAVRQHRLIAVRPAQHGLVGHLRDRQRVGRPARLRRLAIRPARAAGRGGQLGERLSPLDLPGRAAPRRRRADLEPEYARRDLARSPAPDHRGDRRAQSGPARCHGRPRDRDPDQRLRGGLPDAIECP